MLVSVIMAMPRGTHLTRTKRKLLIVLGAGSSLSCGMPSTGDIDLLMRDWSSAWSAPPVYPVGSIGRGVFSDLWEVIADYQSQNPQPHLGIGVNYERVLGEMVALASWATPSPFGNALRNAVRDGGFASSFTWPRDQLGPFFYRLLIIDQLGNLVRQLATHMRQRCLAVAPSSPDFVGYAGLLQRLSDEFDVGIYNLNYDDLAVRALPDAFTGFCHGTFDARAVASRRDWNFVYHLHGSVHHSLDGSSMRPNIVWKEDLSGEFVDSQPLTPSHAAEFRPVIPTTLVAGGFKLDQLLADPAQSLFASFVQHVQQADAFLIAGYGFGDIHVNRALQNRFAVDASGGRRRAPTVIATKTALPGALIGDREGYEFFAWELTHTLSTRFTPSSATQAPRLPIVELIDQSAFETDLFDRAHVWHNGFSEMSDRLEDVIRLLGR